MGRNIVVLSAVIFLISIAPGALSQEEMRQISWDFTGSVAENGTWNMKVTVPKRTYKLGEGLTITVDYTINSPGLAYNIERVSGIYVLITGFRSFDGNGEMIGGSHAMVSTILTGTGLPIQGENHDFPTSRFGSKFHHPLESWIVQKPASLAVDVQKGTIQGTTVHGIMLDQDIPPGWYQLRVDIGVEIADGVLVTLWGENPLSKDTSNDKQSFGITGPLAIGTLAQPRMLWTLFSNNPGGCAIPLEDKGFIAATRGTGYNSRVILPMTDSRGVQARYLLEPDFPLIWNPFMKTEGTPIDLDYKSGWMEVRIENPNGNIVNLGRAKFAGKRGMGATTLEDRFAYSFSTYGRHLIQLKGSINDKSGQAYTGGGVYEIYIAKPLEIKPNILPGTPFKKNDFYDPGVQIYPPYPAKLSITWQLDPYSSGKPTISTFEVNANRFGKFIPPIIEGRNRIDLPTRIQFNTIGEYRVDYVATYQAPDGTFWMGEKTITGYVLPPDAISLSSRPSGPQAFSSSAEARYFPLPAESGNTVHIPSPQTSVPTVFTFPMGFFLKNQSGFRTDDLALQEITTGAAGIFVSPRLATSNGLYPHNYPEYIDRLAYISSYASSWDHSSLVYCGDDCIKTASIFSDYPWLQNELRIDANGDIYHFWSVMVYRDLISNSTKYGFYSAGGVVSDNVASPRIHSSPSTLISDGWGAKNAVIHNLALPPGSIVFDGSSFNPSGYFLPLPPMSKIEFKITPPNEKERIITLNADQTGYFSGMKQRIKLDRPGVWKVQAQVIQGNDIGGVLGVDIGQQWEFYVLNKDNKLPIKFDLPPQVSVLSTDQPLVFNGNLKDSGIVEGKVYISALFNSIVLEQTEREVVNSSFVYSLNLAQVSASFPNFSINDPFDELTITFFVEGVTSVGQYRYAGKFVYLKNGVLHAGEPPYVKIQPTTRQAQPLEQSEIEKTPVSN